MYIVDPLNRSLCGHCLDGCHEGVRPPWKPDGINRRASQIKLSLGIRLDAAALTELIAEFEIAHYMP